MSSCDERGYGEAKRNYQTKPSHVALLFLTSRARLLFQDVRFLTNLSRVRSQNIEQGKFYRELLHASASGGFPYVEIAL